MERDVESTTHKNWLKDYIFAQDVDRKPPFLTPMFET